MMLSLRGHSFNGSHIFLLPQVEMREGGDDWSTCERKGVKDVNGSEEIMSEFNRVQI